MSRETSAGIVLLRRAERGVEMLLVHPGGPFWAKKDEGAWSIPKGVLEPGEDALTAAKRELCEELGIECPPGPFVPLGQARLKSGKLVVAWAAKGEVDPETIKSNEIDIEWPPRSGKKLRIPEIDRAAWATPAEAQRLANPGLLPLLARAASLEIVASVLGGP
jgi:predicted NUDIX family NTP pyrophosphohydrolase